MDQQKYLGAHLEELMHGHSCEEGHTNTTFLLLFTLTWSLSLEQSLNSEKKTSGARCAKIAGFHMERTASSSTFYFTQIVGIIPKQEGT